MGFRAVELAGGVSRATVVNKTFLGLIPAWHLSLAHSAKELNL